MTQHSKFRAIISRISTATAAAIILGAAPAAVHAQDAQVIERGITSDVAALPGVALDPAIRGMLPESVRQKGVLEVATTAFVPPISFFGQNNEEVMGIAPDLVTAFGIIFGVKIAMMDLGMDSAVIPTIRSGRFDMTAGGTFDRVERQKVVDILDYMFDAQTILVPKGNPQNITSINDFCGKTIAVGVGTIQEITVTDKSKECAQPITILSIPKQPEVLAALRSGRADATLNGYATSVYTTVKQIQSGVGLEAIPSVRVNDGYVGMLFHKENTAMRDAAQAALQKLIDTGAYMTIMEKWDVPTLAVKKARINDAGNLPRAD